MAPLPKKVELWSERCDDDPVQRAVFERRVSVIDLARRDPFRHQVVEVHPALQVQLRVHRDVTLRIRRAKIHTDNALLAPNRTKDVQIDVDLWFRHSDQVESATNAKHGQGLSATSFSPTKSKT